MKEGRSCRWLLGLLGVSWLLRICLAASGGQWFWPDESRYGSAQIAAGYLKHGQWRAGLGELFGHADHTLFRLFGLPMALLEQWVGPHPVLAASYFGLFSVLAIYLIWAVARRAGAGDREALWAAYLAAGANTLFYYSRHYFPYDISLCAMLAAWWLALGAWSLRNSWLVGAIVGIGFLTYNGYWLLGGVVLILHVALGDGGAGRAMARAAGSGAGLAMAVGAVVGLGLALGYDLISEYVRYGSVVKGDFHLGYRVIAHYLWTAERGSLAVWGAGLAIALGLAWRDRRLGRLAWYLGGLAGIGGGLIFFSDVMPLFMIQGRLVRSAVPFLILGAANGIDRITAILDLRWRPCSFAVALVAGILAAFNFRVPLRQWFPVQFRVAAMRKATELRRTRPGNYRVVNASFMFTPEVVASVPLPMVTVWRVPHPQQYEPYLYEGAPQKERELFLARDCSMRLVRLAAEDHRGWLGDIPDLGRFEGYPGRVVMRVRLRRDAYGRHEPLVVTGESGKGDFVYVVYQDSAHILLGFDHWAIGGVVSPALAVDFAQDHDFVVGMGSMYPQDFSGQARHRLYVALDGRVVFDQPQDFHPSDPGAVMFGLNLIGGGTTYDRFTGAIKSVASYPP